MLSSQLQAKLSLQHSAGAMQQPEPGRGRTQLHNSKAGKAELPFRGRRTEEIINGLHLLNLSRVLFVRAYRVEEVLKATGTAVSSTASSRVPEEPLPGKRKHFREHTAPSFCGGTEHHKPKTKRHYSFCVCVCWFLPLLLRNAGFITVPFVCRTQR